MIYIFLKRNWIHGNLLIHYVLVGLSLRFKGDEQLTGTGTTFFVTEDALDAKMAELSETRDSGRDITVEDAKKALYSAFKKQQVKFFFIFIWFSIQKLNS